MVDPTLDATALAELVRGGEIRATELVETAIARIEELNPRLNAVIHRLDDDARRRAADPGSGPFAGVPFLTKDLMCATAGQPLHMGNAALRDIDHHATEDTYLAIMFRDSGVVDVGRSNTPELGGSVTTEPVSHGPCRNPWNLDHSTGGSSGGSAAAVAAGIVPMAHANDGGGSIRIPASECGLFGLKPSRGRVSAGPAHGEVWSGAAIEGVVSRSVRDSATMLDCISRPWPGDPYRAPATEATFAAAAVTEPGRLRVGLCTQAPWGPLHAECADAVHSTGMLLESLGHAVDVAHPAAMFEDDFWPNFVTLLAVANAASLDEIGAILGRPVTRDDVEGDTWALARRGRELSGTDYLAAVEWFHAFTRRLAAWWSDDGFDVLVTPVLAGPPPRIGELRDPRVGNRLLRELVQYTPQFNVSGQPAASVPLHWTADGLPVGVQVVGAYGAEEMLLSLGAQLEQARDWASRRPAVFAT